MSNHELSRQEEKTPSPQERLKRIGGRKLLVAAIVVGGLTVGGIMFANNMNRNPNVSTQPTSSQQSNETNPTPEGPQIPEKAEAYGGIEQGLEGEALIKAFEIPAGLSNEEYAQAFINRKNAWTMYGSTPELAKEYWSDGGGASTESTIEKISSENGSNIRSALFSDDIKDSPGSPTKSLVDKFVSNMTTMNRVSLDLWLRTIPYPEIAPGNKEAYVRTTTIDKIEDQSQYAGSKTRSIRITCTEKTNSDKNEAKTLSTNISSEDSQVRYTITTITVNGVEKIVGLFAE